MEKWFSGREFVAARDARQRFGYVRTAIVDSAIAAQRAAPKPGAGNTSMPTGATREVWRADSIIGIGNVRTGDATRRLA